MNMAQKERYRVVVTDQTLTSVAKIVLSIMFFFCQYHEIVIWKFQVSFYFILQLACHHLLEFEWTS